MEESEVGLCSDAVGDKWWNRGPMVLVTEDARRFSVGVAMRTSVGFAGLEDIFDADRQTGKRTGKGEKCNVHLENHVLMTSRQMELLLFLFFFLFSQS